VAHDAEAFMNFLSQPSLNMMESPDPPAPPRRKSWVVKFKVALRGIKLGVRGHSSFFVHFFFTALVIMAAVVLHCDVVDWCILLGCIGFVMTAELFNSTVETLFRGLDEATKERTWPCLDIAAGAVLVASITSAIVGVLVFIHRLVVVYGL
jgi:diacylglycerol kinase